MKTKLLVLAGMLPAFMTTLAQQNSAGIREIITRINTIDGNAVHYYIDLNKPDNAVFDVDGFLSDNANCSCKVRYMESGDTVKLSCQVAPSPKGIIIKLSGMGDKDIKMLSSGDGKAYVDLSDDIRITWKQKKEDGTGTLTISEILTAERVKEATSGSLSLSESQQRELIESMGGEAYLIENHFDFGVQPVKQERYDFYLDYAVSGRYHINALKNLPLFYRSNGRLSTNTEDSLTLVSFYPLNLKVNNKNNLNSEIFLEAGVDANQNFSAGRMVMNAYWQGIIPNIIDLSYGYDRLRLKPVVKAGARFYNEFYNNKPGQPNQISTQFFGELYYYVPVMNHYCIKLNGTAFYDTNAEVNPDGKLWYNYDITLSTDIPGTELKTLFKYIYGYNEVTFQKDEILLVGLLMDLLK